MNQAVIGVGSNIDPEKNIEAARTILKNELKFLRDSTFVKTKPIGIKDQPDFINGTFLIETELDYNELRDYLKDIENRLGRDRTGDTFGPRTIDLDIVVWNGSITDKDYYTRDFLKKTVHEVLSSFKENE